MEYVDKMDVYDVVKTQECYDKTGKSPIMSKWIDINKGDEQARNYRSRWVAMEIRTDNGQWELFAGTPPLEAIKYVIYLCASSKGYRIMSNDISRAFFFADSKSDIYVALPKEAGYDPKQYCAKRKHGFEKAATNPCIFWHKRRGIYNVVHGDDFLSAGKPQDLKWLESKTKEYLEVKVEMLGPKGEVGCVDHIKFLNRIVSWESSGLRYEPDPRHVEILVNQLGLEGAKSVTSPGVTAVWPRSECDEENPKLGGEEASQYRGAAARINFLAQDRVDVQYASKEASRWMSTPRKSDWEAVRRIVRYLVGRPRATQLYKWQSMPTEMRAYSDTDWAGCKTCRRSTSG